MALTPEQRLARRKMIAQRVTANRRAAAMRRYWAMRRFNATGGADPVKDEDEDESGSPDADLADLGDVFRDG